MSLLAIMADCAPESVQLARLLGRVARSRREVENQEQFIPEMFAAGSVELRQWFSEYGSEGRKATWPNPVKDSCARSATDQFSNTETFALNAPPQSTRIKPSPSTKPPTTASKSSRPPKPSSFGTTSTSTQIDTSALSPSHHAAAKDWPDRVLCLEWAAEQEATAKEMIAWRNIQQVTA